MSTSRFDKPRGVMLLEACALSGVVAAFTAEAAKRVVVQRADTEPPHEFGMNRAERRAAKRASRRR